MKLNNFIPKAAYRSAPPKTNVIQTDSFLKSPNTNFMSTLNARVPKANSFTKVKKVDDYGLTNSLVHTGHFKLENPGKGSKILSLRSVDSGSFKQSNGVPKLTNYFNRLAPKNYDYRYTDPQYYEYKLKDASLGKIIQNKWMAENETDPEKLDPLNRSVNMRQAYQEFKNNLKKSKTPPPVLDSTPVLSSSTSSAGEGKSDPIIVSKSSIPISKAQRSIKERNELNRIKQEDYKTFINKDDRSFEEREDDKQRMTEDNSNKRFQDKALQLAEKKIRLIELGRENKEDQEYTILEKRKKMNEFMKDKKELNDKILNYHKLITDPGKKKEYIDTLSQIQTKMDTERKDKIQKRQQLRFAEKEPRLEKIEILGSYKDNVIKFNHLKKQQNKQGNSNLSKEEQIFLKEMAKTIKELKKIDRQKVKELPKAKELPKEQEPEKLPEKSTIVSPQESDVEQSDKESFSSGQPLVTQKFDWNTRQNKIMDHFDFLNEIIAQNPDTKLSTKISQDEMKDFKKDKIIFRSDMKAINIRKAYAKVIQMYDKPTKSIESVKRDYTKLTSDI